jgi:hypothetical protein
VPAYIYPGGQGLAEWERLLKAPSPAAVVIIVNPASGPGKAADDNFTRVIGEARKKGFQVIGYVSTRHGKRPADDVKDDIDRWARFYSDVEGIFLDEQASEADRVEHYAALSDYARAHPRLQLIVGNPGTVPAEGYLARRAADVVCLVESQTPMGKFTPPAWAARYQPGQFAALRHGVADSARMKRIVGAVVEKRIGYVYVTDDVMPNPWDQLPAYWEDELGAVARANERAEQQAP